jgi:S1-C subfamily serine protease
VKKGDIIIGFDGRTDLLRETDLIAWSLQNKKGGSKVVLDILRDGKKQMIPMRIPD